MLITSNRSVAEWGTVFADPVVATAILDREHSRGSAFVLRRGADAAAPPRPWKMSK
jgi:DNA replication protein DnaC